MAQQTKGWTIRSWVLFGVVAIAGCVERTPEANTSEQVSLGPATEKAGGASDQKRPPELEREVGNELAERRSAGPQKPPPKVWFEPTHKLSATGETALRLTIDNWGAPVESELVESLVPLIRLRNPVAGEDLAFTTKVYIPPKPTVVRDVPEKGGEPAAAPGGIARPDDDQRAFIEVVPQQPLSSGWYALALTKVPNGVVAPFESENPPSVGEYSIRFNPASAPTVSRVVMCPKGSKWKGVVEFTEPLHAPTSSVTAALHVDGNGNGCAWMVDPSQQKISSSMGFFCGEMGADSEVKLSLLATIKAQSGADLADLDGKTTWSKSVTLGALEDSKAGPGCKEWDL